METASLYSLEVYIKDVLHVSLPCGVPALSFRFLDYPTVIIYAVELYELESLKEKVHTVNSGIDCKDLKDLRNQSNGYDFNKGKSCLFTKDFKQLKKLLTHVPLYLTLVDSLPDQPKLLGLCSVSLLSLIQTIENTKIQSFEDSPAVSSEKFSVNICNLMGTKIAHLNMNLRLTCFGSSLLRHVTVEEKTDSQINIIMQNLSLNDTNSNKNKKQHYKKPLEILENEKIEHYIIPGDGKPFERCSEKEDKSSQCDPNNRISKLQTKIKKSTHEIRNKASQYCEEDDSVNIDNTVRPPPLFLNLTENDNATAQKHVKQLSSSKYLLESKFDEFDDEISSDEEALIETLIPVAGRSNIYTFGSKEKTSEEHELSKITKSTTKNNKIERVQNIHAYTSEMPILCSLLKEISKFNDFINNPNNEKEKKPEITHVNFPDQEKTVNKKEKSDIANHLLSHLRMDRKNDSILDEYENKQTPITVGRAQKARSSNGKGKKEHPSNRRVKSGRITKQSYGLTKTQRLRYAMTHDGEDPLKQNNSERNKTGDEVSVAAQKSKVLKKYLRRDSGKRHKARKNHREDGGKIILLNK